MKRINVKTILADAELKKELMVRVIIAMQAREGITTTETQATRAYLKIIQERP